MDNHKKNGSCKKQSVICKKCNTWVPSIPHKFRQHAKNCKGEEEREVVEQEVEEQVVEEQEIEEQEVEEQAVEVVGEHVVGEQEIELDMDEELNGRRQEAPDHEMGRQEEQKSRKTPDLYPAKIKKQFCIVTSLSPPPCLSDTPSPCPPPDSIPCQHLLLPPAHHLPRQSRRMLIPSNRIS